MKTLQLTLIAALTMSAVGHAQFTAQSAGNQGNQVLRPKGWKWPMPGTDGQDWVVNNYVDLDSGPGILDYAGGSKSYNGHRGIDIDVPTFRAMDADFPIRAVADGTVVAFDDAHFDRNTSCTGQWNFVRVEHTDGHTAIYGHLKQNSVVVSVGQTVAKGEALGVVGSSGCSTAPHLHLEVLDTKTGDLVDPMTEGLFANPPVYDTPLSLMDYVIADSPVTTIPAILNAGPNETSLPFGDTLGVGLSVAGGEAFDSIRVAVYKPSGALYADHDIAFGQTYRHSYWVCNWSIPEVIGTWRVEVEMNGGLVQSHDFLRAPALGAARIMRPKVQFEDNQKEFNYMLANGYRPISRSGWNDGTNAYFSVVYEQGWSVNWIDRSFLDEQGFDDLMVQLINANWRPISIDSFVHNGVMRYSVLGDSSAGPDWTAYRSNSPSAHQTNFNTLVGQGYRPVSITPEQLNGNLEVTALYDKAAVGAWAAWYGDDSAGYQQRVNDQAALGRYPKFINVYDVNGTPRFSAVWDSVGFNGYVARHDISQSTLESQDAQWTGQGLALQLVSGYENGGTTDFAAFWIN